VWLNAYQVWYEISVIGDADNADLLVVTNMLAISALLTLARVIPGHNRLPHGLKVYRVIWRDQYWERAEPATRRRD